MTSKNKINNVIDSLQGTGKTFAEFLALLFKDKKVEIYLGDSYEDISTEQTSTSYPSVICGKVIAAYKECLVIQAYHVNRPRNIKEIGNVMFINERAIRALNEITGDYVLEDMLLRSKDSSFVKDIDNNK